MHHSSFMPHHSPPLHPYTPLGGQTLHCARALHGILRSGGQPSQFSTLVHPSTPSGGQTHIHTCLPVREAHLRALAWAARAVMLAFRLFFCSDAYVDVFWYASLYSGGCGLPICTVERLTFMPHKSHSTAAP